jgi:hypothetical protein
MKIISADEILAERSGAKVLRIGPYIPAPLQVPRVPRFDLDVANEGDALALLRAIRSRVVVLGSEQAIDGANKERDRSELFKHLD